MPAQPIAPVVQDFAGLTADPYWPATVVAPPALVEDLAAINLLVLAAATTPYAVCGLLHDGGESDAGDWHFAWRHNCGTQLMRPLVGRSSLESSSGTMLPTLLRETTGSPAGDAEVETPFPDGVDVYPPGAIVLLAPGSDKYNASPADDEPRALNCTPALAPRTERVYGRRWCGISAVPVLVGDLSAM